RTPYTGTRFGLSDSRGALPRTPVREARVVLVEVQIHDASRAIALLADDELRLAFDRVPVLVHGTVVHLLPEQETDKVGVLFDGTRFTQIGQLWPVVAGPLFRRARQLR